MPESDFSRVGPGTGIDRVEGTRPPDMLRETQNVRHDSASYRPMYIRAPGELPPAIEPPPAPKPAPLTEQERRERLRDAMAIEASARAEMEHAADAHRRAEDRCAECRLTLARQDSLQDEINAYAIDALRTNGDATMPAELEERLMTRAVAESDLSAAMRAAKVLAQESATARDRHGRTTWAVTAALRAVLDITRDQLREAMKVFELKVAAYLQVIQRGEGAYPWHQVCEALSADPLNASIEVTVPDAPMPEVAHALPGVQAFDDRVTIMRPNGPAEVVTTAEAAQRDRAARAASTPMANALAEAEALKRSRQGAA